MCWSEEFRYGSCGHYLRENSPCPTQQDSHRYEPDWLTECQMFDCQPARHRPGFCGKCHYYYIERYAHNFTGASNSGIDHSAPTTRSDSTGRSSSNTSNGANSFTPPTSDDSNDSSIPWQYRHREDTLSNPLPQARTAISLRYEAAEKRRSAPPDSHGTPIDYGRSLRNKTGQVYHNRLRRIQERVAEAFGLTWVKVNALMLNAQGEQARGRSEAASYSHT
ncbi:hypothetical protein HBI70_190150 [Parastagonospora nodorum]|nr:hypothetical protein HBH51_123100 [Parastagonospora nodorum]KAH4007072.1 hypothetical protein HBI10_018380 [Parastagonospora nodorum]KAH4015390.1 hypothetical protein HBI13_162250 [Parastagonospora nodorum]KAH4100593.1 hypothetical protein HBH46_151710 [Parastagonospora nodorum]KAH4121065.1 hypothetical protein HBH47_106750 [Parastagonospora nodorum]